MKSKSPFVYIENIISQTESEYLKILYVNFTSKRVIIETTKEGNIIKVIPPWFPSGPFRFMLSDEEKKNHKFKTVIVI